MAAVNSPPAAHRAWRSPSAAAWFLGIAAAGLAGDLLSKHHAFDWLLSDPAASARLRAARASSPRASARQLLAESHYSRPVCPGVRFTLSTNPGVVFGLKVPRPVVNAATICAMAIVVAIFATSDRRHRWLHAGLGCVLAGAMGNLYDRLFSRVALPLDRPEFIRYEVRDFIDLGQLHYPWVFNVADALLVVGVGILMVHWMRPAARPKPRGASAAGRSA